jgi:hypothetical protein
MTDQIWIADVTLRAYNHWRSIHPTRKNAIINKCRERITHLCKEDANEISAFLGADEMGDSVGDIDDMFD